jgi:hypothetical protein
VYVQNHRDQAQAEMYQDIKRGVSNHAQIQALQISVCLATEISNFPPTDQKLLIRQGQ